MSAQAQIDIMSEDSGNPGRDDYIKSALSPGEASFNPSKTQEDIKIILQLELSDKEPMPTPVPS
jgi:hypothetical protein